jgi:hypothetical protein
LFSSSSSAAFSLFFISLNKHYLFSLASSTCKLILLFSSYSLIYSSLIANYSYFNSFSTAYNAVPAVDATLLSIAASFSSSSLSLTL